MASLVDKPEDTQAAQKGRELEIHRLSIQHEVVKAAMGGLVLAPIDLSKAGHNILDCATTDGKHLTLRSAISSAVHSLSLFIIALANLPRNLASRSSFRNPGRAVLSRN